MTSNLSALFDNAKKVTLVSVPKEEKRVSFSVKEESENETDEEETSGSSKKKTKVQREHEDLALANAQTVFVGNVPNGCTQKQLKSLFSEFGKVETVRLRNLIPLNAKRGKRLAFIKKEFHPLQRTITAFIRFADESEAREATSLNGHLYNEHHLRVNMAHEQHEDTKHDHKRSIFIGNLPFDVNDDDVWNAFEECGEIENVRLVRDSATSVGKGFGYVLFQDEASVALALRMNENCKVGNRQIRIKPAVKKPKPARFNASSKNRQPLNGKSKPRKAFRSADKNGVQQGRVEKRPAVKLKKEKQKMKKKKLSTKTNNTRKDVIQLKKKN